MVSGLPVPWMVLKSSKLMETNRKLMETDTDDGEPTHITGGGGGDDSKCHVMFNDIV